MATPAFTRVVEDFACGHCGAPVKGNGYTNHCPHCLWSRHVDVNPGDRAAECGAMMCPVGVEGNANEYVLVHSCVACGYKKRNKLAPNDEFEAVLAVAAHNKN